MLTSELFRFAKPTAPALSVNVRALTVGVQTSQFTNEVDMAPINLGVFDVIDAQGMVLNRSGLFEPDYWFESGKLKVRKPGTYTLRVYDSLLPFEENVLSIGKRFAPSAGGKFKVGVPFWTQILTQPQHGGIARVANDGRNIAIVPQGYKGQDSFSYRMVNAFGQVTEPACVYILSM